MSCDVSISLSLSLSLYLSDSLENLLNATSQAVVACGIHAANLPTPPWTSAFQQKYIRRVRCSMQRSRAGTLCCGAAMFCACVPPACSGWICHRVTVHRVITEDKKNGGMYYTSFGMIIIFYHVATAASWWSSVVGGDTVSLVNLSLSHAVQCRPWFLRRMVTASCRTGRAMRVPRPFVCTSWALGSANGRETMEVREDLAVMAARALTDQSRLRVLGSSDEHRSSIAVSTYR